MQASSKSPSSPPTSEPSSRRALHQSVIRQQGQASLFSPLGVASNSEGTLGPRDISDHQSVRAKASKASQIKEVDESWRLM